MKIKPFIIGSYGQSASRWLTTVLNLHSDVRVLGARDDWSGFTPPSNQKIPLTGNEIFAIDSDCVLGCIHRHSVESFHLLEDLPELNGRVYNLIRHPILRAHSAARALSKTINNHNQFANQVKGTYANLIPEWEKQLDKTWADPDFRGFIMAMALLGNYVYELSYENTNIGFDKSKQIQCEKLTQDRVYFAEFIDVLLDGQSQVDENYLEEVFSPNFTPENNPKITHNLGEKITNPLQVLDLWGSEKREIFNWFAEKFQLREAFKSTDYHVDY